MSLVGRTSKQPALAALLLSLAIALEVTVGRDPAQGPAFLTLAPAAAAIAWTSGAATALVAAAVGLVALAWLVGPPAWHGAALNLLACAAAIMVVRAARRAPAEDPASLRESAERFELAAEALDGLIYEVDVRTGYVERTRGLFELVGYHPREVPPTVEWWAQQVHPHDLARAQALAVAPGGRTVVNCYRVRHRDGRWIPVEDRAVALRDADGRVVRLIGCTVDVTERMRALADLERKEAALRLCLRHGLMGTWEFDHRTLRVVTSGSTDDLYGLSPAAGERTLDDYLPSVHPEDRERLREETIAAAARGTEISVEYRLLRPDGTVRWIASRGDLIKDETGQVVRMVGALMDITERKRVEDALRASEERFRAFMDNSPARAWLKDEDGRYVYANPALQCAFGLTEGDLLGRTDAELFDPAFAATYRQNDRAILSSGRPVQLAEDSAERDGLRHFLTVKFPVRDAAGARYVGGMAVDVTERRRAEEALREADRRKDEFLATLAHELRNPLAPIRMATELLDLAGAPNPTARKAREVLLRQVNHLVRLVDDLLDLSRISRGRIELLRAPVALDQIVQSAVETSGPLLAAGKHELIVRVPPEPLVVLGDAVRLTQVLANLLNNAARYTPEPGQVHVTLERDGDRAVVRVRDTGVGIAPGALERVFEMFAQVDQSGRFPGGLGIGLTLVRRLVELHGGQVEARSEGEGRGAEFVVRLPLAACQVPSSPPGAGAAPSAPRRRILVVDDNVDAGETLAEALSARGHEARSAPDGASGVALARGFAPEVVVLDLGMPGLDGYETARRLRELPGGADLTLVALTGWGQPDDRRRTQQAGFDAHLVKPIAPAALEGLFAAPPRRPSAAAGADSAEVEG